MVRMTFKYSVLGLSLLGLAGVGLLTSSRPDSRHPGAAPHNQTPSATDNGTYGAESPFHAPYLASDDVSSCAERVQAHFNCSEPACVDQADGYINYLMAYHCEWEDAKPFMFTLFCVWLLFLLYLLGDTADEYFCPTLQTIVMLFGISPNIAGVTFLSFGNGAPDVFAALAANLNGSTGFSVGSILGAGVFITTVIVGAVALTSTVVLNRRPFLRDVGFNIVATCYLLFAFLDGEVTLAEAIGFVGLYVLFALTVIFGRKIYQSAKKRRAQQQRSESDLLGMGDIQEAEDAAEAEEDERDAEAGDYFLALGRFGRNRSRSVEWFWGSRQPAALRQHKVLTGGDSTKDLLNRPLLSGMDFVDAAETGTAKSHLSPLDASSIAPSDASTQDRDVSVSPRRRASSFSAVSAAKIAQAMEHNRAHERHDHHHEHSLFHHHTSWAKAFVAALQEEHIPDVGEEDAVNSKPQSLDAKLAGSEAGDEQELTGLRKCWNSACGEDAIMNKILTWLLLPSQLLRRITVPMVEEESWDFRFALCTPTCGLMMLGYVACPGDSFTGPLTDDGPSGVGLWIPLLVLALVWTGLMWFKMDHQEAPTGKVLGVFTLFSFVMSIVWILVVANEIVSLVNAIGLIIDLSPTVLALTVVAWGNSLGDLVADVTVAKEGYPAMALAACFAGPMFNLLIGQGLSLTITTIKSDTHSVSMGETNASANLCFIFLLISLVLSFVIVPIDKFRIRRAYGIFLIVLYCVFLALSLYYR